LCLGVAALRPAPLILGLALVLLLSIPWVMAVRLRLADETSPPVGDT
jgi:4-amino-4-deoxy-L-arabinose transferase-like glycosyltransferase